MREMESRIATAIHRLGGDRGNDPALTDLETTWTFGELASQAAAVAAQLSEQPDSSSVGLLTDRHLSSVAAVIGTLWSGRGQVVQDVDEPVERLAELFARAGVGVVLDATGNGPGRVGDHEVLALRKPIADPAQWIPVRQVGGNAQCSVQFTSGSTGRAKGVVKSFVTYETNLDVWGTYSALLEPKRTAVAMPLQFAAGISPVVFGLTTGRFTMLVDPRVHSTALLLASLGEYGIERLHATPSFLRSLSADRALFGNYDLRKVREIWLTGEPAVWGDVALARERFGPLVTVVSNYSATEALGPRASTVIGPHGALGEGRLPLGRPVTPDAVRLDLTGRTDGSGELIYRGLLSDGYLDDPELNASRYGVDPDGVPIWRSGDLVQIDAEGVIHLRGRIDDMVKINGKLVEPAEAERVLTALPGMRNVIVLPRVLPSGRQQLVAHLETDGSLTPAVVRAALSRELPANLIPSVLVQHESLPLNDRGKVDRGALSSLLVKPWREANPEPVTDRLVEAVLSVARLVLEIDDIGADESLLDLGMDSLGAIEFVALVNEAGEGHLEANDLVAANTCRLIAERLRAGHSRRRTRSTTFNDDGRERPLFFVAGGGGFPLTYRSLAMELGVEQPLVVLEQRGLRSRAWPERTVAAAARHHLREVRRLQPAGPYLLAGHSYGGIVAHCIAGMLHRQGHDVSLIVLDSVHSVRRELFVPEAIRTRQSSLAIHAVKWVKWRSVLAWRRLAGLATPIGSVERFGVFFQWALHALNRHTVEPLDVPMLAICVSDGTAREWEGHLTVSITRVSGDHLTMLQPPHVSDVAQAMGTFVSRAG